MIISHLAESYIGLLSAQGIFSKLNLPYVAMQGNIRAYQDGVVFVGTTPEAPPRLVYYDLKQKKETILLDTKNSHNTLSKKDIAIAKPIVFENSEKMPTHAFYYPPTNAEYTGKPKTAPPLVVMLHGGPTFMTDPGFKLKIQFWTNRGFAVVDVNYSGSTGFGRAYQERLHGKWGVLEVNDCIHAVDYLVAEGKANPNQCVITGGSAGGYTTLAALTFHKKFHAGASYYGVADCTMLAKDTHKFEAHYLDGLIGPYPEKEELYKERSPLFHFKNINCPLIIFQGQEDKVVPPSQAEAMVAILEQKRLPYAYVNFEKEGHGFRDPNNVAYALEAEYTFYARIFGFNIELKTDLVIHHL